MTGLEHDKIIAEYEELLEFIAGLLFILRSPERLMEVIKEELEEILAEYRKVVSRNTEDRYLSVDIRNSAEFLKKNFN